MRQEERLNNGQKNLKRYWKNNDEIHWEIDDYDFDVCSTWSAVENLLDGFQAICQKYKTLIICDEHHHAAVSAALGNKRNKALKTQNMFLF